MARITPSSMYLAMNYQHTPSMEFEDEEFLAHLFGTQVNHIFRQSMMSKMTQIALSHFSPLSPSLTLSLKHTHYLLNILDPILFNSSTCVLSLDFLLLQIQVVYLAGIIYDGYFQETTSHYCTKASIIILLCYLEYFSVCKYLLFISLFGLEIVTY